VTRALPLAALIVLLSNRLYAATARSGDSAPTDTCGPALLRSLHDAQRQLDSLRPDKSGQTRVFAPDGSEFTTGQAKWMKAELRSVEQSCALGNATAASEHLSNVQNLLQSHVFK
jgi:hypothetical protein